MFGEVFNTREISQRKVLNNLISGANRRKLSFEITKDELWLLFLKQGRCCALSGRRLSFVPINYSRNYRLQSASLDRIDSSLPYVLDNLQWVHKDVNKMKTNFKQADFLFFCGEISKKKFLKTKTPQKKSLHRREHLT